jgi:hypothetical protein
MRVNPAQDFLQNINVIQMILPLMYNIVKRFIYTIPGLLFLLTTIQNLASCNAGILKHERELCAGNTNIFLSQLFFPPVSFYLYETIVLINSA